MAPPDEPQDQMARALYQVFSGPTITVFADENLSRFAQVIRFPLPVDDEPSGEGSPSGSHTSAYLDGDSSRSRLVPKLDV